MSRKLPLTYNLYDAVYESDFPEGQYFVICFDETPSKYAIKHLFDQSIREYFVSLGFTNLWKAEITKRNYSIVHEEIYISQTKQIMIKFDFLGKTEDGLVHIDYLYNLKNGKIQDQLDFDVIGEFKREKKKSNISLVKASAGYMDTEDFDINVPDVNLEMNYGRDFLKIHNTIVKRLNTDHDKGIILLHGEPGTGKTSYLRYLTKFITDKDILFIPPSMAEMLSEPSIIPFLMEHRNSILIIEDAERVISDRDNNGSAAGVSNLLNLTDGILGDCLNVQVIATFNTRRDRIDKALLRKGRLIAEHKFEELSVKETNLLLAFLNKGIVSDKSLTLADIYNIDSDELRVSKEPSKIGFNHGK